VGKQLTIETQTFPHCYTDFRGGGLLQTVPCVNHAASFPLRMLEVMQIIFHASIFAFYLLENGHVFGGIMLDAIVQIN
jgi:hypothetical protein